jgi:hypothetical protein
MQSDTFEANGITLKQPVAKEIADLTTAIERLALQSKSRQGPESNGRDVKALLAETVNETTNNLNGIINYAQLLYDSSDQLQLTAEQMMMLQKIIDSGAHIAHEWQKIK